MTDVMMKDEMTDETTDETTDAANVVMMTVVTKIVADAGDAKHFLETLFRNTF